MISNKSSKSAFNAAAGDQEAGPAAADPTKKVGRSDTAAPEYYMGGPRGKLNCATPREDAATASGEGTAQAMQEERKPGRAFPAAPPKPGVLTDNFNDKARTR